MARASTPTLLALDRYAAIIGLTPPHFNQGLSAIVFPFDNSCNDITYQHPWQHADASSREDIAREIAIAEQSIADYLGWWPAPRWIAQDVKMFPRFHRPEYYSIGALNVRGQHKSIRTAYGKIIEPGQRATTLIGQVTVAGGTLVYSDEDGDGFNETATVTIATTLTDECEVKVYFAGHNGEPEWEIRPARTKVIAGGVMTATFWKWQFIEPANWEAFPTQADGVPSVNLDDGGVYVTEADVYREYNDPTAVSAVLYWEPQPGAISGGCCTFCGTAGCAACTLTEQNGCAHIRDAEKGIVVPAPATYDDSESQWAAASWSVCRDPDEVKLYYYCGNLSELNLAGRRCDGLSDQWAKIIAWLATSRLRRPVCSCGSAGALVRWLQTDVAADAGDVSYSVLWDDLSNPFGTRIGEMEAWRYLKNLVRGKQKGAFAV